MEEACRRGDFEAIQYLVAKDPENVRQPDAIGITPLHRVAAANHLHIARYLIAKGADVNAVDKYNDAPLKKAAYRGYYDFVVYLVHQGANVNHKDGSGKIALHHSAEQGQLQSVEVMLDARADVDCVSAEGFTPLHLAAQNGHSWCCKALIVAGAYVDARGGRSLSTPLHLAAEKGHKHTVQLLIAERADVNITDGQQRKPFNLSKGGPGSETFKAFQSPFVKTMCHGPSCTAEGPGVYGRPRADDACMFLIIPRDRYGVALRDELGLLNFSVDGEEVTTGLIVPAKVIPNSRMGNHVCYFDASKIGNYRVHVYLEDFRMEGEMRGGGRRAPIAGSPYGILVLPAPLDPYTTRATGPGVTETQAGCKAVFTVFGRDRFQNPSSEGKLTVLIQPLNRPPPNLEIIDSGNGDFFVSYTAPPECGVYALTVAIDGKRHIYNSPFAVYVRPGPVYAGHCSLGGRGLVQGGLNLPMRFHIHVSDRLGNALTSGGLQWSIQIHELLRPGQEYESEQARRRRRADDSSEEEDSASGEEEEEEEGAAPTLASPKTGERLQVEGLEHEIARFGKRLAHTLLDHRNGTYTCEFRGSRVGRLEIVVELVSPNGDTQALPGSPSYPLVSAIPEWGPEEVGLFLERIGFPELSRQFMLQDVSGARLCALTELLLETELAVTNKSTQRSLVHLIGEEMQSEVVLEAVQGMSELTLAQLGVVDKNTRERLVALVSQTLENTQEAHEREEVYQTQLKKRLTALGNTLQDDLRMTLEDVMTEFTDTLLEEWTNGKFQNNLMALTDDMRGLEGTIKAKLEFRSRVAGIIKFRTPTLEEQAQGITEEDLDDAEPLFQPPPATPPGAYLAAQAEKEAALKAGQEEGSRGGTRRGSRGGTAGSRPGETAYQKRQREMEEKEKERILAAMMADDSDYEGEEEEEEHKATSPTGTLEAMQGKREGGGGQGESGGDSVGNEDDRVEGGRGGGSRSGGGGVRGAGSLGASPLDMPAEPVAGAGAGREAGRAQGAHAAAPAPEP